LINAQAFHQHNLYRQIHFGVRWKPDFVVHVLLFQHYPSARLQSSEQPAGDFEFVIQTSFESRDLFSLLVYPHNSDQLLNATFVKILWLYSRLGLEIKNDHIAAAKALASWIDEIAQAQKDA